MGNGTCGGQWDNIKEVGRVEYEVGDEAAPVYELIVVAARESDASGELDESALEVAKESPATK